MEDWIGVLAACSSRQEVAVLVTVASARGSVPRDPGTRMVVTAMHQHGTIGGGSLELQALGIARDLLAAQAGDASALRRFPLGAALGQCCGGLVYLMFERIMPGPAPASWLGQVGRCRARGEACMLVSAAGRSAPCGPLVVTEDGCHGTLGDLWTDRVARTLARDLLGAGASTRLVSLVAGGPPFLLDPLYASGMEIVLFGAGHVGQALAKLLADLPCRVTWIDERADRFPTSPAVNIRVVVSDAQTDEVAAARAGCCFLVMTHSHPLDQALSEAILRRDDFRYFGLIGSVAKRRRFEHRLVARGIDAEVLAKMTCPIGIAGIEGKEPGVIALSVAAQLLTLRAGDGGQDVRGERAGRGKRTAAPPAAPSAAAPLIACRYGPPQSS